jgi:titin
MSPSTRERLPGNVVSGNNNGGILFADQASGNLVQGNLIGTHAAGTGGLANIGDGIFAGEPNDTIGGTAAAARDVISGGNSNGIEVRSNATGVLVLGNYIGTNAAGTSSLGNLLNGVVIDTSDNTIGGTAFAAANLISVNSNDGVNIDNGANSNVVQGNYIGTNLTATAVVVNGSYGNAIGPYNSNNILGGNVVADANVIAYNATGVVYLGHGGTSNTVPSMLMAAARELC